MAFGRKKEDLQTSPMVRAVDNFRREMPPMSTVLRGGSGGENSLQQYLQENLEFVNWAARNGLGTQAIEARVGAIYFTTLANTVLEQMRLGGNMIAVLSGANRKIYDICTENDPVRMASKALGLCESISHRFSALSGEKPSFASRLGVAIRRKDDSDWDQMVGFGLIEPWMGLIQNIAENAPAIRRDIATATKEEISQAANYIRLKGVIGEIRKDIEKKEKEGNVISSNVRGDVIPLERGVDRADFAEMRRRLTEVMQDVITCVAERGDVGDKVKDLQKIVMEMEHIPEASVKEMRRCVDLGLKATRVYLTGIGVEVADAVYEAAAMTRFTTIVNACNLSMLGILGLSQAITSAAIMNTQITTAMLGEMSLTVSGSKFDPREVVRVVIDRWRQQNEIVRKQTMQVAERPDRIDMGGFAKQARQNKQLLDR